MQPLTEVAEGGWMGVSQATHPPTFQLTCLAYLLASEGKLRLLESEVVWYLVKIMAAFAQDHNVKSTKHSYLRQYREGLIIFHAV